jgi:hypothetical protein
MTVFPIKNLHLHVCPLQQDQVDQAFAGLELSGLSLSKTVWRDYAVDRINAGPSKAGVLSLQCARAYLHGLLGYEIAIVGSERHMNVDLFRTAYYLSDKSASSLMVAAEAIAADEQCVAIHLDLPDFKDATIIALKPRSLAILCQDGYAIDSIQLSKTLAFSISADR